MEVLDNDIRGDRPFAQFIGKLSEAVQSDEGKEVPYFLIKKLDLRMPEYWQHILRQIRKREDVIGFLKAYQNIASSSHQKQVNALETYSFQRLARRPEYQ